MTPTEIDMRPTLVAPSRRRSQALLDGAARFVRILCGVPDSIAALIPIKAFDIGKTRLMDALDPESRSALAEKLARAVVAVCAAAMPTYVTCENDEVQAWAENLGAQVIRGQESGLNRVVRHGVASLGAAGFERVLVAHGDLADPRGLPALAGWAGVVLVPDRRLDGTNAIVVPTQARFSFSYGPGSFARHLSEAERFGELHVINDDGLALDLDEPADLVEFQHLDTTDNRSTPRER